MQLQTLPKPPRPDAMAQQLARVMEPGDMVMLPHSQAAALAHTANSLGKHVRLRVATGTHSSVECHSEPRCRIATQAARTWLSQRACRAVATGALALVLALLAAGCGGGCDLDDDLQHTPRVDCVAQPGACQ
jgi:hypothetical protein